MAYAHRIRMLVVHSDALAREGLCAIFARCPDLEVLSDAPHGSEAPPSPRRLVEMNVNVVVADYESGVELAEAIAHHAGRDAPCRVLVVDSVDREWEIRNALSRGVRGYILFGCALDELVNGVRAVHWGQRYLSTLVSQRLAESLSGAELTSREQEVLQLVVQGLSNKTIARRLGIAVGTVKSHLKGIFEKLHVESRTQATCVVERRGLLGQATKRGWSLPARTAAGFHGLASMPATQVAEQGGASASAEAPRG